MSRIIGYHDDPQYGRRPILKDGDYNDLERLHRFYQTDAQLYFAAKVFPEELRSPYEEGRIVYLEKEFKETEDEYLAALAEYLEKDHEPTRDRMTWRYDPDELHSYDYNRACFLTRLKNSWMAVFVSLFFLACIWLILDYIGSLELTGLFWGLVLLDGFLGIVAGSLNHYSHQEKQAFIHNIYHEKSKAHQDQDVFHWAVKASSVKTKS